MNLGINTVLSSDLMNRFANRRLRNENHDLKAKNIQLKKQYQQQRDRANQLTVTLKTTRSRCSTLRKELREYEEMFGPKVEVVEVLDLTHEDPMGVIRVDDMIDS